MFMMKVSKILAGVLLLAAIQPAEARCGEAPGSAPEKRATAQLCVSANAAQGGQQPVIISGDVVVADPMRFRPETTAEEQRQLEKQHRRAAAKRFSQPVVALKVNLLYGGATFTPNLRMDIGLGGCTSLEIGGSWNPWDPRDGKSVEHWMVGAELRYWLCARHSGHFFGLHPFYADYNITGYKIPKLFDKALRYDGTAVGGGVTYGYHLMLGRHWGLEFHVGAGVAKLEYTKYRTADGEEASLGDFKTTYIGPTRAGISAVFLF